MSPAAYRVPFMPVTSLVGKSGTHLPSVRPSVWDTAPRPDATRLEQARPVKELRAAGNGDLEDRYGTGLGQPLQRMSHPCGGWYCPVQSGPGNFNPKHRQFVFSRQA